MLARSVLDGPLAAEAIEHDAPSVAEIARAGNGSLRDALSLLDQAIAFGGGALRADDVRTMLGTVDRGRIAALLEAVVAGDAELDLKACARLGGFRACELVPLKEVQPLTGYVRGGVTVFGAKKDLPVYVDEEIELHDVVSVSAGVRGTQIFVAPGDYVRASQATLGPISRPVTR